MVWFSCKTNPIFVFNFSRQSIICFQCKRQNFEFMNFSMKAVLVLGLIGLNLVWNNVLQAQNTITTAVPFLLISPDTRANGMGEANVAIADNANAMFWNPAGLGYQRGFDVSLTHTNWLPAFNADLFYDNVSAKYHLPGYGTFALGITYLNLGESEYTDDKGQSKGIFKSYEFAVAIAYGVRIHRFLAVGTSIRYIHSSLTPSSVKVGQEEGSGKGSSISFDMAAMFRPVFKGYLADRLSLGINISNIGPKMTYFDEAQADPLPTNLKFGAAFRAYNDDFNKLTVALDFNKLLVKRNDDGDAEGVLSAMFSSWGDGFETINVGLGAEYWYGRPSLFAIRGGYFYEDPDYGGREYWTFGVGVRVFKFGVDFSYLSALEEDHPLDGTVRFSLAYYVPTAGLR